MREETPFQKLFEAARSWDREEYTRADQAVNDPAILSKIKFPRYMYHVTPMKNLSTIQKEGIRLGVKGRGTVKIGMVGDPTGRIYLTNDYHSMIDSMEGLIEEDLGVVKVDTTGMEIRLDPEYYTELGYTASPKLISEIPELIAEVGAFSVYVEASIPPEKISVIRT